MRLERGGDGALAGKVRLLQGARCGATGEIEAAVDVAEGKAGPLKSGLDVCDGVEPALHGLVYAHMHNRPSILKGEACNASLLIGFVFGIYRKE